VTCSKCRTENAPGAKFCVECGESFKGRCPKCGLANPANANVRAGDRFTLGYYIDSRRTYSIEAGYFSLAAQSTSFQQTSDGTVILARPFVDINTQLPAANLVAFPGLVSGSPDEGDGDNEDPSSTGPGPPTNPGDTTQTSTSPEATATLPSDTTTGTDTTDAFRSVTVMARSTAPGSLPRTCVAPLTTIGGV